MNILICIGANARIIQHCLKVKNIEFDITHLLSRNIYSGFSPPNSIHWNLVDPLLILLKIKEISDTANDCDKISIIFSSFCTERNAPSSESNIWDPAFSVTLQTLVLNLKNITRLTILGSTQAFWYPLPKDVYLTNKILELDGFLRLSSLDKESKLCYVALPPMDKSTNFIGKFFIKSRKDCANVIIDSLGDKSRLVAPKGIFGLLAKLLFFKRIVVSDFKSEA